MRDCGKLIKNFFSQNKKSKFLMSSYCREFIKNYEKVA